MGAYGQPEFTAGISKDKPTEMGWNATSGEQALEEAVEGINAKPKEGLYVLRDPSFGKW